MVNRIAQYDSQPEPDDDCDDRPPFDADDEWDDDEGDDDFEPCATVGQVERVEDELDAHLKDYQQYREQTQVRLHSLELANNLLVFLAVCAAGGFLGWVLWGHR